MTEAVKTSFQSLSENQQFRIADGVRYYSDDLETERLIFQSVAKLPEEIQEFVFDRCCFLSVGNNVCGSAFPGDVGYHPMLRTPEGIEWAIQNDRLMDFLREPPWLIALAENHISSMPEADAESLIAHEVAHAWLSHDRFSPECPEDCEAQACILTKEWGFDGIGTNVSLQQPKLTDE